MNKLKNIVFRYLISKVSYKIDVRGRFLGPGQVFYYCTYIWGEQESYPPTGGWDFFPTNFSKKKSV